MKKKLILFLFILCLTSGCYDYQEINNMAIVSGISIDYINEKFHIAFEILNTLNPENNKDTEKIYHVKGIGSSISEAFSNASLEIAKSPYMAHLKTVVIDEVTAKDHLEEIVDFFIRDNHIRNIFYLVTTKNSKAEDILYKTDVNNPIASTAIADLIDNTKYTHNIASTLNFEKFFIDLIDSRKDAYLTTIEIDNDVLKLGPLAIFSGYHLKTYLSQTDSAIFNLINGSSEEMHIQIDCPNDPDKFIIFSTFSIPESSIEIQNNTATLSAEVETRIIENHCDMDFKKIKTYEELQKAIAKKIKKSTEDLVQRLTRANSDILKIEQAYYQKYKKDIDFRNLNYEYKVNAIINRNGLIFEVMK